MTPAKPGLQKAEIDWEEFEQLCSFHCTRTEIADFFKIHPETLSNHIKKHYGATFNEVWEEKSSRGKRNVRKKQYAVAMSGNIAMLIWLGKQWLGQSEKTEVTSGKGFKFELAYSLPKKEDEDTPSDDGEHGA